MTGPGVDSALPASANAATSSARPLSPSGRHTPVRASIATVRTPSLRVPAAWRLSFGTMLSAVRGVAGPAAREPRDASTAYAIHLVMAGRVRGMRRRWAECARGAPSPPGGVDEAGGLSYERSLVGVASGLGAAPSAPRRGTGGQPCLLARVEHPGTGKEPDPEGSLEGEAGATAGHDVDQELGVLPDFVL